jgi:hypothetical protein
LSIDPVQPSMPPPHRDHADAPDADGYAGTTTDIR